MQNKNNGSLPGQERSERNKKDLLRKSLAVWFVAVFIISAAAFFSYAVMQQTLRQQANWPQVQMAEDAAAALVSGQAADSLVSTGKVNIAASLSPFLVIYDANGNAVAFSGTLDGNAPKIPSGVLDYVAKNGEDRITWMPDKSTRIAVVAARVDGGPGGFVLAGRSLRETEATIDNIGKLVLAMWAGTVALLLAICLFYALIKKKRN